MHIFLHRGHKLNCKKVSMLKSCLKAWETRQATELNKKVCKLIQLVNNHYWYMKSEDNIFLQNGLCKLWIFNKQPHARTCLTQPQVNFPEGSRKWKQSCHKNSQCLWQMATSHTVQTITCLADRKCRTAGMYVATQRALIFLTKEGNMMCDLQANTRINRITAETLECNRAHLSSTLHSLFPLLLFCSFPLHLFSLFSTPLQEVHTGVYFWIGQKECMPFPVHAVSIWTYEEMHKSNRRVFQEAAITSSPDSQYLPITVSCPLWETLRIKHPI